MKPKALIVEDDDRIIVSLEDTLFSIGHEHDWVTNQYDAQRRLRASDYSYVLLDLQIPAKPGGDSADKEFGCNLLQDIQQIKGRGRLPVIVMTAYSSDCVDLTTELFAAGASEFIAKPFQNKGRTLAKVIRKVLEDRQELVPMPDTPGDTADTPAGRPFTGGELTFFADRAELCGVKIITDMGAGQSLMMLQELRKRDRRGHYIRMSGEELAKAIQAPGGVGAITGCVRAVRRNVIKRLLKHRNLICQNDDLIRSDEQGYYLREWVTTADGTEKITTADVTGDVPQRDVIASGDTSVADSELALNERQEWALSQLRLGIRLQRSDLERQFGTHARTAKRDLLELNQLGLLEFAGEGRAGYYRLRERKGRG